MWFTCCGAPLVQCLLRTTALPSTGGVNTMKEAPQKRDKELEV